MTDRDKLTEIIYRHTPVYNSVDHCECGGEFTPGHLADRIIDAGLLRTPTPSWWQKCLHYLGWWP